MSVPMSKEDQAKYWKNQEAIAATQNPPSRLPALSEDGIGTEMTTPEELKWMHKFHWVLMATGEGAACRVVQGTNIIRELHDFSCCCGNSDTCTDEARIGAVEDLKDKDQWGTDESGDLFQWSFDHECGHVYITRVDRMPSPSTEDDPCKMTDSQYEEYIYGPNRAKWPTSEVLTDGPAEGIDNTPWMDYEDAGKEAYAEERVIVFKAKPTGQKFAAHPEGHYIALTLPVEPAAPVVAPKVIGVLSYEEHRRACMFNLPAYVFGSSPRNPAPTESKLSQPTPVVVSEIDPAVKLLADVLHLWIDGYITKSSNSLAPLSISSNVFDEIERFLIANRITVDYCGWTAQPAPIPSGDKNTFEEVLINRAGEYRDMEREHRRREEHEAACTCSDKASGIHVALKLFRLWNASKEPPGLPVGQKETFEEWWKTASNGIYPKGSSWEYAARLAWTAAKGQEETK